MQILKTKRDMVFLIMVILGISSSLLTIKVSNMFIITYGLWVSLILVIVGFRMCSTKFELWLSSKIKK